MNFVVIILALYERRLTKDKAGRLKRKTNVLFENIGPFSLVTGRMDYFFRAASRAAVI